jgi:hypothetical protein
MNLMVIFRKYKNKIMAVVVIALMIVFTIQPVMDYFSSARTSGRKGIATYGNGKKITREDVEAANQQIEVLKSMGIETVLRPQDPRMAGAQDLRVILLGELIFPERTSAIESVTRIRQLISVQGIAVSDKMINEIYIKQHPASIYWILLNREASEAGIKIQSAQAKSQLQMLLPRLNRDALYEEIIAAMEKHRRIYEEQMVEAFGNLVSVIEYCRTVCSTENRTIQQILDQASFRDEAMDVNYVLMESDVFADQSFNPAANKVTEQFEKYKSDFSGTVSEQNPYGFGYKLPDKVKLEYIAVRLDDVAVTVKALTQQEIEDYYQQHLQMFTQTVLSDPNDPNSEPVAKTRSFAEVASLISKRLYQQRVDSKAERILSDAKSITEAGLSGGDIEQSKLADEQFKKAAVDYEKVASDLTEKHKVKVYAGKTGFLSASDVQGDKYLSTLYVGGAGYTESPLVRVLFAIEQLKISQLGPMDVRVPRLYENIGPLKDAREMTSDYSGKNMMLVRVIEAQKAAEPKGIDEKIDKHGIQFGSQKSAGEDSNTVKELVIADLRRLAAMDETANKAREFVNIASKDGWENAIDKFNQLYGKSKSDVNSLSRQEKTFKLVKRSGLRRLSGMDIDDAKIIAEGNPLARMLLNRTKGEAMLIDKFYAVVPADSNTLAKPGAIIEFKPGISYYCLENVTIHRLYQEVFDMVKAGGIVRDEFTEAQSLAFVQYNPGNILKRMNYVQLQERQEVNEPNSSAADTNRADK